MADPQPERLGRLARSLAAQDDPGAVLDEIVAAAVELVPGVETGLNRLLQHRFGGGSVAARRGLRLASSRSALCGVCC